MGLLKKRIKEIMQLELHMIEENGLTVRGTQEEALIKVVEEMTKEIGNTKWLDELKQYILKHSIKLTDETPIFSARCFARKIDEHKEKLEKWLCEEKEKEAD